MGGGLGMGGHLAKMFVGVGDGLGMGSFGENVCRGGGWTRDGGGHLAKMFVRVGDGLGMGGHLAKYLSGWGMD